VIVAVLALLSDCPGFSHYSDSTRKNAIPASYLSDSVRRSWDTSGERRSGAPSLLVESVVEEKSHEETSNME
jgi:hypothetical protein